MMNFHYHIPTDIFFGKGAIENLPENLKKYGTKVLLVYGGESIKKMGLYDVVMKLLNENGFTVHELPGVKPNPRIESVREGVKLCREHDIEVVLAVGGGSVIDCSKVIASGYYYDGDPWDLVLDRKKHGKCLPVASVLTLSATGSEMDSAAVITNLETHQKYGTGSPAMAPVFSILDPEYTYSVSPYQTASGSADIMSHIFESYFSNEKDCFMIDRMAEGLLKTVIRYAPIAYKEPKNYEARANLMWTSSWAINGLIGYGKPEAWSVHPLEHELSAYFDITHGVGLAILTPHWMRAALNKDTLWKFVEYGVNVWNIDPKLPEMEIAEKAIEKTSEFFRTLDIPPRLRDVGITEESLPVMAKALKERNKGLIKGFVPMDEEFCLKVYKAAF